MATLPNVKARPMPKFMAPPIMQAMRRGRGLGGNATPLQSGRSTWLYRRSRGCQAGAQKGRMPRAARPKWIQACCVTSPTSANPMHRVGVKRRPQLSSESSAGE